jgi:phosphoserine phosphatase
MMTTLIVQGEQLTLAAAMEIATDLAGELTDKNRYFIIETTQQVSANQIQALREKYSFDVNIIPDNFVAEEVALLVTDMDSTLISIECVDEIADFIGAKPQVAAITESAMRGEIDFETSLRQRVSLLKGLDVKALEQVYQHRLQLNPGAETLIKGLKERGIKTALVSGGFTFFTERLKAELGLDYTMANVLEEKDGQLTGEVLGDICGAQSKADFLLAHCQKLSILPSQVIAMGDGANDLLMMQEAGLSVAYHAKPKVQKQAKAVINHNGLDGVLAMLRHDFI